MARKQSMTERVLIQLRNDIINCEYNDNDIITEAEISQKFNVSKTPSREALNYLCMERFLEKIPNKGYLVKGISISDLQSLFQFRAILENASAELAIKYASDDELRLLSQRVEDQVARANTNNYAEFSEMNMDFHISVAYLSRNPHLIAALENNLNQLRRVLIKDWKISDSKMLLGAHSELVEAIQNRNQEQAKAYITKEIDEAEDRIYTNRRQERY